MSKYILNVCQETVHHGHGNDFASTSFSEWSEEFDSLKLATEGFRSIEDLGTMGAVEFEGETVKVF